MAAPLAVVWRTLRARDPSRYTLKRALRAAVVVPVNFAIGSQLIGNAQLATFCAFGSFALLLFVNFPGGRLARAQAFLLLGVGGAVVIAVGTLLATPDWLAVLAMAVVAFAILFAGVLSATINGGVQATLLAFILAIMLPGVRADLPYRLGGWAIAVGVCVPVALFVWPPNDQNVLRNKAAALCRALAVMLHLEPVAPGRPDPLVAMRRAARELRTAFTSSATRSGALSTGARLLIRLVDELDWLTSVVTNACADAADGWPEQGRRLRAEAALVLQASATTLDHDGSGPAPAACVDLDGCLAELDRARSAVADEAVASLRAGAMAGAAPSPDQRDVRAGASGAAGAAGAGEFERPLYAAHELGYAVALAGNTVALIAAADSRSWWAQVAGRALPAGVPGRAEVVQRIASGHLDRHSVWFQNSVRGAAGLALAVLLSRVVDAQNAFWIGLGALSVLRSTALSTGTTVLRALFGTVVGFAIGGAVVAAIGTNHAVLWTLLPLVILVAANAPTVISFLAGQAAFTVFTIILFNIIAPAGWRIGVFRVEDVALGCLAALVAGVLFWPRGAAAALGVAYADAYRAAARYLHASIEQLLGHAAMPAEDAASAYAAGNRLDDALRQYLAEQGAKHVPLDTVAALANGAVRLRLAGTAIAKLERGAPDGTVVPAGDDRLAGPAHVLQDRATEVGGWYVALADEFAGHAGALPAITDASADAASFLDAVLPAIDRCGDPERAARAEQLLWSGQYLGDVDRLRFDLLEPAGQVRAAQSRPWWRR